MSNDIAAAAVHLLRQMGATVLAQEIEQLQRRNAYLEEYNKTHLRVAGFTLSRWQGTKPKHPGICIDIPTKYQKACRGALSHCVYLNDEHSEQTLYALCDALLRQHEATVPKPEKLCEDEGCPQHGKPHVCRQPARSTVVKKAPRVK